MLEDIAKRVGAVELYKIPVGKAILLLAGLGISETLIPTASALTRLPPIATGPALAIVSQLPITKRFLGDTMATVIATTAVAIAVDQQLNIRGRTAALVASITGRLAPAPTAGPAAPVAMGQVAPAALMSEQERRTMATLRIR